MSLYKPGTLDSQDVVSRWERRRRRLLNESATPGKTQIYQTTDKLDDSLVYEAGDNIDITGGVISAPEMSAGEMDNICTFA